MDNYLYELQLIARLLLALVCGALLGYERERHGISAGLRTNLLVCLGSALMMIISKNFFYAQGDIAMNIDVGLDPSRIAAQIVTGVGFLGAGVIIKDKGSIRGLTTAATLWLNAAVGMAAGLGMVVIPVACTVIGLVSLTILKTIQKKVRRDIYEAVNITCSDFEHSLDQLTEFFARQNFTVEKVSLHKVNKQELTYKFILKCDRTCIDYVSFIKELTKLDFIRKVKVV